MRNVAVEMQMNIMENNYECEEIKQFCFILEYRIT